MKKDSFIEIDPSIIRFQHSKIKPIFSDGKSIEESFKQIKENIKILDTIPKIQVKYDNNGNYYTLNNRRLYLYKKLKDEGIIKTIKVRLDKLNDKETKRYNVDNCSLTAKFMFNIKNKDENIDKDIDNEKDEINEDE